MLAAPPHAAAARVATFLRVQFQTLRYGRSHAAQLLSAIKRCLLWAAAEAKSMPAAEMILEPSRRLLRSWSKRESVECRIPVPLDVALGLFSVFMASWDLAGAVIVMLGFHCLIRTEELMTMT